MSDDYFISISKSFMVIITQYILRTRSVTRTKCGIETLDQHEGRVTHLIKNTLTHRSQAGLKLYCVPHY
jgi:hypothetical protein